MSCATMVDRLPRRTFIATAVGLCLFVACAATSRAALLYNISSFDPNDATTTSSTSVQYDPNLVAITVAPGLTGTSATDLLALQTLNAGAGTGTTGSRFQNTDVDAAQTNGTLIADASANYVQFGITGGAGSINLTSLTFDAKKATAGVATRGYNVVVSVDGGPYTPLGSANLVADRNAAPFDNVVLPTTGAGFTGLSSVNFRINSTGGGVEYTNIAINGTVPEPAGLSLLAVAALAPLARRHRRAA